MTKNLSVIKLGGSLLTDKTKPYTANDDVISSVAKELRQCLNSGLLENLIIVHGVGSFGHVPVLKYKLHQGYQNKNQLIAMSQTQHEINEFRLKITKIFIEYELPVNLLHASSFCVSEKTKISESFLKAIIGYMSIGMIPLIGGDMLYDSQMGFSVGGGDQLVVLLAKDLKAERVIFVSDVDGVYDSDPKSNPESKIFELLTVKELKDIIEKTDSSPFKDASGAMRGKLQAIYSLKNEITKGQKVYLISMKKYGNLTSVLHEDHTNILYTRFIE